MSFSKQRPCIVCICYTAPGFCFTIVAPSKEWLTSKRIRNLSQLFNKVQDPSVSYVCLLFSCVLTRCNRVLSFMTAMNDGDDNALMDPAMESFVLLSVRSIGRSSEWRDLCHAMVPKPWCLCSAQRNMPNNKSFLEWKFGKQFRRAQLIYEKCAHIFERQREKLYIRSTLNIAPCGYEDYHS